MTGRLTLPTDADVIDETLRLKNLLGADALRDCDGTEMPEELLSEPVKKYATYYTTRKDNEWASANPEEIQQEYLISNRVTARGETLRIRLMEGFHTEQLKVNTLDDPKRWWEVIDRTTGEIVPTDKWEFDEASGEVEIQTKSYHEYTVSFLAFLIWDPVHMYNFITNDWQDTPHQLTYDVRQPKTQKYVKEKLKRWCEENPNIDVVRFTTFFHQFTLTFDDQKREKYVEWFGYSASVSPYILEKFEKWAGYKFRPEFIVDQGYHNSMFRVPSKQFRDFIEFQQIEVCALAKEMVDIVHSYGKEAITAQMKQAEAEAQLAREVSRIGTDEVEEEESDLGKTRVLDSIRRMPAAEAGQNVTAKQETEPEDDEPEIEELDDEPELPRMANHLMIEARSPEKGMEIAIQTLKQIQKETGIKNPVAKITGSKLNKRGILACADKLSGKDLMIEEAGDLTPQMIGELEALMTRDTSGMRIILIDNPKQMEMLHAQNPSLADKFECIGCDYPPVQSPEPVREREPEVHQEPEPDERPVRRVEPVNDEAMRAPEPEVLEEDEPAEEEEMDIDEFAQYCCKYASEIDCSITGKSMLALYERIEIMEEDGIPLTRKAAEALIEEAADRAEKPSLGKAIKGLFSSKYDKDGMLILKEEHFI